jgi:hypothetical protein
MKKYNWTDKSTDPIKRRVLNFLKRGAIPSSVMPLVSKITGWAMIPAELYQGHKALTKTIPEKEKKIAEIAKAKGYDVNKVMNMYRHAYDKIGLNREWFYKPLYSQSKTKTFNEVSEYAALRKDPEYEEIKKIFDNDYIAKYYENKERGELRRAKYFMNKDSEYYVPFPTSMPKEEDVMKGSVIDKDDLATGGIASLLKW